MKCFGFSDRSHNLKKLKDEFFDLVIIGGGINGAGVARDAMLRGMKVALVEANDFASGTSSKSSKLIHGGIRYLENYEFHLVFEALNERTKLFQIAPHLVHPLRFMLPVYKDSRHGMAALGVGMFLYDALSLFEAPEGHERLSPDESVERSPFLRRDGLLGSYVYSDAYMDDDRLVIETLRSANELGLVCANYCEAQKINYAELRNDIRKSGFSRPGAKNSKEISDSSNKRIESIEVKDKFTGEKIQIRGKVFVSAVGAWTDQLHAKLINKDKKILRPTKGIHIVLNKGRLPLKQAVVLGVEERIVFAIPRHEMLIVGTTDTDFKDTPDNVATNKDDMQYLFNVVHQYFPEANLKESDILSSYAGVRPLVLDGAESEGKTSREHTIWTDDFGMVFIAGGKYTTYRLIAEQVVAKCLEQFSVEEKVGFGKSKTNTPLNKYVVQYDESALYDISKQIVSKSRLSKAEADLLAQRYGFEAVEIIKEFGPNLSYWKYEAAQAICRSMAVHFKDIIFRRTPLNLAYADHGEFAWREMMDIFSEFKKMSKSEIDEEISLLRQEIAKENTWRNLIQK